MVFIYYIGSVVLGAILYGLKLDWAGGLFWLILFPLWVGHLLKVIQTMLTIYGIREITEAQAAMEGKCALCGQNLPMRERTRLEDFPLR